MTFNGRKGNFNLTEEERKNDNRWSGSGEGCNDDNKYGDDDRWSFRATDGHDQGNSGGIGRDREPHVYPPYRRRGRNLRSTMTFNGTKGKSNDLSRAADDRMRGSPWNGSEEDFSDDRGYEHDDRWSSRATEGSYGGNYEDIRPRQKPDVFHFLERAPVGERFLHWRDNHEYEEDKRDEREHGERAPAARTYGVSSRSPGTDHSQATRLSATRYSSRDRSAPLFHQEYEAVYETRESEQRAQHASPYGDRSCASGEYDSERGYESQARCVSSEQYFFVHRGNGGEQIGCSRFPQAPESLENETAEVNSSKGNEHRQLDEEPNQREVDSPGLELVPSPSDDSDSAYELVETSDEESDDDNAVPPLGFAPEVRHCRAFAALLELKKKKKLMRIVKEQNSKLIYTVEMLIKFMTVYK